MGETASAPAAPADPRLEDKQPLNAFKTKKPVRSYSMYRTSSPNPNNATLQTSKKQDNGDTKNETAGNGDSDGSSAASEAADESEEDAGSSADQGAESDANDAGSGERSDGNADDAGDAHSDADGNGAAAVLDAAFNADRDLDSQNEDAGEGEDEDEGEDEEKNVEAEYRVSTDWSNTIVDPRSMGLLRLMRKPMIRELHGMIFCLVMAADESMLLKARFKYDTHTQFLVEAKNCDENSLFSLLCIFAPECLDSEAQVNISVRSDAAQVKLQLLRPNVSNKSWILDLCDVNLGRNFFGSKGEELPPLMAPTAPTTVTASAMGNFLPAPRQQITATSAAAAAAAATEPSSAGTAANPTAPATLSAGSAIPACKCASCCRSAGFGTIGINGSNGNNAVMLPYWPFHSNYKNTESLFINAP